jgi:DnaJ-domain-containing protein 1
MDLNSRLFDRIRVKPAVRTPEKAAPATPCSFPGCTAEGVFRAPKGREREGEYFSFCRDHVREYNATYDYFRGMDDASMAKFRQADAVGHRPTWKMGARAAAAGQPVDESVFAEARAARRRGAKGKPPQTEPPPRYNALAIKALLTLELGGDATPAKIKTRYKELVKRHHPDANGGDRSSEERLREIIQAYNFLRAPEIRV